MFRSHSGWTSLVLAATFAAVSCGRNPVSPSGPTQTPSATPVPAPAADAAPRILSLTVTDITREAATFTWTTDQPTDMYLEFDTSATFTTPKTHRRLTSPQMSTSHSVPQFDLQSGSTYYVQVRATNAAGRSTASEITTFVTPVAPDGSLASALTIASFRMIEIQYPGYPGWYYAPEIEVRETTGVANAIVTKLAVSVPGVVGAPPYRTSKCVGAGSQMALLHEVYGDYELTIDHNGARSPGGVATAEVTFEDPSGREGKVTATGPIVAGGFPATYSSPPLSWGCSSATSSATRR